LFQRHKAAQTIRLAITQRMRVLEHWTARLSVASTTAPLQINTCVPTTRRANYGVPLVMLDKLVTAIRVVAVTPALPVG
jgi:hypothetical protein